MGDEDGTRARELCLPRASCRYVMAIADNLGDGEVEEDEMTQAIATWHALLGDQEMIACEAASPQLIHSHVGALTCLDMAPGRQRSTFRHLRQGQHRHAGQAAGRLGAKGAPVHARAPGTVVLSAPARWWQLSEL